ncbi:carbon-nitrogen hydrolase family protein [Lentibacillus jeotgali]|uniref:carbon-nitrogen hydrolase family protein n=1 Tax=Lentibacillus jeotgali TaxID=558169 RepID=UPI000262745B|nr:carbon-nitrogen hydrolase family protein [Lentibacillus jeotgali]
MSEQQSYPKIKAAAVQISPVFPFNKKKTITKMLEYVKEAADNQAEIAVFPECFIPAYPNWSIDFNEPSRWEEDLADFTLECVNIGRGDLEPLQRAAKENRITVVTGINEIIDHYDGVIFNSLVTIGSDGELLNVHRKVFPSNREKMFHTRGDVNGLNVVDTAAGRVGGLICYEHLQPMLKYGLITQGEQIHCASWPGWPVFENGRSNKGVIETASKAYALEGQCFVIASSFYVSKDEEGIDSIGNASWDYFGGSAIISPSGEYLAGPLYDKEGIVYADLDFSLIPKRKASVDVTGRDSYPEGFDVTFNRRNRDLIDFS